MPRDPYLTPVPDDPTDIIPHAYHLGLARDDLDGRMRAAIQEMAGWYAQAQGAPDEEASFYWGRQLYHVMRPVVSLARKLQGLPPEQPCTTCGTEEGGASSGPDGHGGRFSLCAWCAADGWNRVGEQE